MSLCSSLGLCVVLSLVSCGCIGSSGGAGTDVVTTPPPISTPGTAPLVTTDGTRFVDRNGATVVLRGVDVHTLDPAVYAHAAALGVNFIRLTVPWSEYELLPPSHGRHTWNQPRLAELDRLIAYCAANRIEVLLDFHQYGWSPFFAKVQRGGLAKGIPAWFYERRSFQPTVDGRDAAEIQFYSDRRATALYADFAVMMATRYRASANVLGYEIMNEPATGAYSSGHWLTQRVVRWESRILTAIRLADPRRTVVFMLRGGPSLGAKGADLSAFGSLDHLALDVHDYFAATGGSGYSPDGENTSLGFRSTLQGGRYRGTSESQSQYLDVSLAAAKSWNMPLIVGEWGAFNGTPGLSVYQRQMVSLFEEKGVSWARWSLYNRERLGLLTRNLIPTPAAEQLAELIAHPPSPAATGG